MSYSSYNEFQNLCKPSRIVTSSYKFIPKNTCSKKNAFFNTYKYPYIYGNPSPYVQPINFVNEQKARLQGSGLQFQTTSNQFRNPTFNYNPDFNQISDESILNTRYTDPGVQQALDSARSYGAIN